PPCNARDVTTAYTPGMTDEPRIATSAQPARGAHQLQSVQQPFSAHRCAVARGSRIRPSAARGAGRAADLTMRFGREYYQRYYFDPRTAVATRREMQARARLIAALTAHVGLPVRRILEAGCGTGMLRAALRRRLPGAHYVALESSEYLCRRYGWQRGRIEAYRAAAPFDLVICYDVLQYLEPAAARRALVNFGRLCCGVLYFSALTRLDFERNCDPQRTDADVH